MAVELVFTALAQDRPGIVERLAEAVAEHGGNWVDSDMARLGGEFAGIVRVSVEEAQAQPLEQTLNGLAGDGITVTVRRDQPAGEPGGRAAHIELIGQDHPGIVLQATRALSALGVSVQQLHTAVFQGSMSGEPMFSAQIDVVLPEGVATGDLRASMEDLAQDLMVEIDLTDLDAALA